MAGLPQTRDRKRGWYLGAVLVTIVAGLASRHFSHLVPAFLGKYPGDVLWALMVFFGWGLAFPKASTGRVAVLALATSYAIEVLKLWRSPWWAGVRHTTAGHLVFGQVFSWQNLVAYTVGVGLGVVIEVTVRRQKPALAGDTDEG